MAQMLNTQQEAAVGSLVAKGVEFARAVDIVLGIEKGKYMTTDELIKVAGYSCKGQNGGRKR